MSVQALAALSLVTGLTLVIDTSSAKGSFSDARPKCRGKLATIVGTPRDDEIVGTAKADVIVGRGGLDRIEGGDGNDIICGGPSAVRVTEGEVDYQYLSGGPGNDVVVGGPHVDALTDVDGSDLILGRGDGDLISDLDRGPGRHDDVLRGGRGNDLLASIRGDDRLHGGPGDDSFQDALGDNVLSGGGGNDRLESGQGNDAIFGGAGMDTSTYFTILRIGSMSSHCNGVTVDLAKGVASGAGFGIDALKGVENVATGGGEDSFIGDARDNILYVSSACPEVPHQHDYVAGGDGRDRIAFTSRSFFTGGSSLGPVEVDLASGSAVQRSQYIDGSAEFTLESIEDVTGTEFPDVISGDDGPNRLSGGWPQSMGAGDTIDGRKGNDRLSGSDGRDTIHGGEGDDTLRGLRGNDGVDGGLGNNTIRGGPGRDQCQNPGQYDGARGCEA